MIRSRRFLAIKLSWIESPSVSLRSTAPLAGRESWVFASEWNERGDPDRSQNGLILIWIASLSLAMTGLRSSPSVSLTLDSSPSRERKISLCSQWEFRIEIIHRQDQDQPQYLRWNVLTGWIFGLHNYYGSPEKKMKADHFGQEEVRLRGGGASLKGRLYWA